MRYKVTAIIKSAKEQYYKSLIAINTLFWGICIGFAICTCSLVE